MAKNIVAAGLASRCEVQLGWAIGLPRPVSVRINTFGTQTVSSEALLRGVNSHFDLSVFGIITTLDLLVPRYRKTACYGHFGRDSFPWEVTDQSGAIIRRRWTLSRRRAAQLNLLQEKFMSGKSLGLIETVGMSAAVEAADAAMKSANVSLVGYELTKGGGMVTVKLEGEVGAINAAVAAAISAASRVGEVYAHKVIARTAQHIEQIIHSKVTAGVAEPQPEVPAAQPTLQAENAPSQTFPVVNLDTSISASCMDVTDETLKSVEQHQPVKPSIENTKPTKSDVPQEAAKKGPRSSGKKK
ncbi:S-adenosylmethionine synthetase [Escherichia coli]|nr:S-adenosylmethionine synthetase [Escherichia coli]